MMGIQTEVVITCTGRADDPDIQEKISTLLRKLSQAAGADERMCNLKSVEPWNSVKVSFDLPREAAIRLQELARSGDDALIDLGILSVQIANGEPFDLNAIRELLQQPPPPQVPLPHQVGEPPNTPTVSGAVSMPYQQVRQPHQPQQQNLPGTSKPLQAPMQMPTVNQVRKQTPKRSPSMTPQVPPPRPSSSGTLPPRTPASSLVGLHTQIPSGGMKSPPYLTGPSPTSSIGNIPAGIPSLHLGQPTKSFNPNPPMNISSSNSFSSVYSIAMSASGNPDASIQAPMMQSLPNLPTPQSAPIGSFPWNLGAKQPQFASGGGQPQVLPQWNQPMFPGIPNVPTNLPGSIPSVGPLPSPSRMPTPRPVAPQAKPKKKKKRPRKPPKDKIPPIPLPPPLMPPVPKPPPSSEEIPLQKPLGMPLPGLNPISPNEVSVMPNQNPTPASHRQHPRFPFTQAQISQAGGSDVSMTSPLLVNLLQSDIASTQFQVQSGESVRAPGLGPSQRMPNTSLHLGTTMPHAVSDGSHYPRNQQLHAYPHLLHRQQQQPQQPPQQQQHGPPMPQLSLPNQTVRPDSGRRSIESFQQQQQQPFPTHMPYLPGAPGTPPTSFNRFSLPQGSLPPDHLQFMMQQVSSQAALTEHRMPVTPQIPHSRGNWSSGNLPTMTTVPSMASSNAGGVSTLIPTPPMQNDPPPPKEPSEQKDPKSTSFDEESAMAGMTEAERDTFAAAARIAQDSKPGGMEVDTYGEIATPSGELPTGKKGDFLMPPELSEGYPPQNKSAHSMFATENQAVSHQKPGKKAKKHESPVNMQQAVGQSHRSTVHQPSSSHQGTAAGSGDKLSEMSLQQSYPKLRLSSLESAANDSIDLNSLQSSCAPASLIQKMTPPSLPFHSKVMSQSGQTDVLQNPFLAMPSIPSSVGPGQNTSSHFTRAPGGSIPNLNISQGWAGGNPTSKVDAHQLDSVGKPRGAPTDICSTPAVPPKALPTNPYEWPFSNISPPTQNLSSEGLQFMAKLAAVPGDSQFRAQHEMPHYSPQPDGSRSGKPDKPHLKALLNEISPSAEGQGGSPRATKRLSTEEKSERKRRKSSPRPVPLDQIPNMLYQPQRRIDHPGGSIELPRVPTAEELSFSVQQARAHSLDLLKGASGYPPIPKSAPSSPRGKNRTKSVENIPQYGLQQSDLYRSKHGTLSPVSPMPGGFKMSTSSSKSGKSKDSKSRSKSPKASGNKSNKVDASGFQSLPPVTTATSVPFAGVHEFRPPPGLNIRGPANPLPYQNRKTPPQVVETQSPLSPQGISQFGSKQYQQQSPLPPAAAETRGKSPRGSRPTSPFASASALLSSFAQSAGIKGPELPTTKPGAAAADSPIQSPGYVTSPPLQKISTPTLPSNVSLGAPEENYPDDFHPGSTKGRAEGVTSFPTSAVESDDKRHFQSTEQSSIPPYPGTTVAQIGPQMPVGRILSPSEFPGGHGINREGHFQTVPAKFPTASQPGVPSLWRPQTSKQHLVSSDPKAQGLNVTMPSTSKYETANVSALRRNIGLSAPQPVQSQDVEIPVGDGTNMPQFMAGDIVPGKGHRHGLANLPASPSMPIGFHPNESFTGQHHALNLRQSEANLLAFRTSLDGNHTQEPAVGLSKHDPTSVTEVSGTPPWQYGGPNRLTFYSGMASTVEHAITTSTIGQPGQPMTRVTRVIPIPQTGSSVQSHSGTTTAPAVPQLGSLGMGKSPSSIPQIRNFPAPFSVSSLMSNPSVTHRSQPSDEQRVPGIPTSQQVMSASSVSPGPTKLEQTSDGNTPSLPRPLGSAPSVTMENVSAVTGPVGSGLQSSTALEEPSIPLQESGDSPPLGLGKKITGNSADVTATTLSSSPGLGPRGQVHMSSTSPVREEGWSQSRVGASSPGGEPSAAGIPMSESSGLPPGGSWLNSSQSSTSDGAGNFGGSTIDSQPGSSTAPLEMTEVACTTSSEPQPRVGKQPVQMNMERVQQLQEQSGEIHIPMDSVRRDASHPMVHGMPEPGDLDEHVPKGGEAERVPPQPGTIEFMSPQVASTTANDDGSGLTQGASSPGEARDDGDGEDEDSATLRKRSMRASGREKYYGPVPTYKRRKSNQK